MLKNRIKYGFKNFCEGTSIHGFKDLYHSNVGLWKILWLVILCGAIGKLSIQVTSTIKQFINQPSVTIVQTVTEEELTYPPLKLCTAHWVHWLDWERAFNLSFTKEAILFGMSYLTNVYSSHKFDIANAKEDFKSAMVLNNISTMEEFYKRIFIPYLNPNYYLNSFNSFEDVEFDSNDNYNYFCYKSEGTKILSTFRKRRTHLDKKYTVFLELDTLSFNISKYTTKDEYDSYMAEWIQKKTYEYILKEIDSTSSDYSYSYSEVKNDYSKVQPPNRLYVDGYGQTYINVMPEIDVYFVTLKASAQRLKNKVNMKCLPGIKSFTSDTTCLANCDLLVKHECGFTADDSFEYAIKFNQSTKPEKLSLNKIKFLNDSDELVQNEVISKTELDIKNDSGIYTNLSETNIDQNGENKCNWSEIWQHCVSSNCALDGCEKWTYDVTVFTRSLHHSLHDVAYKQRTSIYIHYPSRTNVLIMIEVESKSWEEFIGNVGGLLGIWTGASVISFFQLIYLCCFSYKTESSEKNGYNSKFNISESYRHDDANIFKGDKSGSVEKDHMIK